MNYAVYKITFPDDMVYVGATKDVPVRCRADKYNHGLIKDYDFDSGRLSVIAKGIPEPLAKLIETLLIYYYTDNDRSLNSQKRSYDIETNETIDTRRHISLKDCISIISGISEWENDLFTGILENLYKGHPGKGFSDITEKQVTWLRDNGFNSKYHSRAESWVIKINGLPDFNTKTYNND